MSDDKPLSFNNLKSFDDAGGFDRPAGSELAATHGSASRLPDSVLAEYPPMTACLHYRDGSGKVKDWFIAADPKRDNAETLTAHLRKHLPAAELVGWAIK